ncbi:MAG: zinc metallopeptidase [Ruminococcaceae bacterium]|nr:zinc metallopeptidase [Oscillospiraceae bacterium]
MFIDQWYIILVLPAILLSLWASANVNSTFKKYSSVMSSRYITGAESARRVLEANGVYGVQIEHVSGNLTDHFDPRTNTIRLSDSVYSSTSVAAIGVAAHEAGHAVQYAKGYAPMKFRAFIIPVTNIGSNLAMPLILLGIVLSMPFLAELGILAFSFSTLFQLVTVPVEFNASKRAMAAIESETDDPSEIKGAKKVLKAAALTYVAALAVSLANLLRLIMIVNGGRRRN